MSRIIFGSGCSSLRQSDGCKARLLKSRPGPGAQLLHASGSVIVRGTLNGYSGGAPLSHWEFLISPSAETLAQVAARLGIPEDQISLVETLDPPSDDSGGAAGQ